MLSDYAEERRAKIRATNAKNKARSRQMESRVMKYLKGKRVPMSGSGSIKGDGQLLCDKGYVLIECKCTESTDSKGPIIRMPFSWLTDLTLNAHIMDAAISAIVFHFQSSRMKDYVLMPASVYEKLAGAVDTSSLVIVDKSHKKGWSVYQYYLEEVLTEHDSIMGMLSNQGLYIVMRLPYFKYLLHGDECA